MLTANALPFSSSKTYPPSNASASHVNIDSDAFFGNQQQTMFQTRTYPPSTAFASNVNIDADAFFDNRPQENQPNKPTTAARHTLFGKPSATLSSNPNIVQDYEQGMHPNRTYYSSKAASNDYATTNAEPAPRRTTNSQTIPSLEQTSLGELNIK